ncbi:MAG: VWA domain-containing protein [Pirellulales bacterium]
MNSRRFLTALLATSFIVPLGILPARGDDAAKAAFKSVKSGLQAKLRNRDDATRLEALDELRQYPTADAAKLVLGIMQTRQSDAVQQAAYQTLLSFKDEEDVGRLLLTTLQKGARRNAPTDITPLLLKIVLLSNHPDIEKKTLERIDAVANASGGSLPVMELADSLGASAEPDDAARLLKLTKLKAYSREFGIRRAVTQAVTNFKCPEGVAAAIELLKLEQGENAADLAQYLADATGQKHGEDPKAWQAWWDANQKSYKFPDNFARTARGAAAAGQEASSYYGLHISAHRVLFVLDTSQSMEGARLEAAKRELIQAINGLPPETSFSIVVFNSVLAAWQQQLVEAQPQTKEAAARFVAGQVARGGTGTLGALTAAFVFDVEAMYLLTDGMPNDAKPLDILSRVAELNRGRRLSLYTIGVGAGPPGGPMDQFLSTLAKNNWGLYVRVDQ